MGRSARTFSTILIGWVQVSGASSDSSISFHTSGMIDWANSRSKTPWSRRKPLSMNARSSEVDSCLRTNTRIKPRHDSLLLGPWVGCQILR